MPIDRVLHTKNWVGGEIAGGGGAWEEGGEGRKGPSEVVILGKCMITRGRTRIHKCMYACANLMYTFFGSDVSCVSDRAFKCVSV